MTESIAISHDSTGNRYLLSVDGKRVGSVTYQDTGEVLVVDHTEVDPAFGGQGLGSRLARHALDDARVKGRRVIPTCPFISHWIDTHPEYRDLLDPGGG